MIVVISVCLALTLISYLYFRLLKFYRLFKYASKPICIINEQDEVCYANRAYRALASNKKSLAIYDLFCSSNEAVNSLYLLKSRAAKGETAMLELAFEAHSRMRVHAQLLHNRGMLLWTFELIQNNLISNIPNNEKDLIENCSIDAIPVAACIINTGGEIEAHNAQFNSFFSLNKITKSRLKLQDIIDSRKIETFLSTLNETKMAELSTEVVAENNNNKKFHIIAKIHTGYNRALIILLETTENTAVEEALGQNQNLQAVGQLAGGVAHDFNNILTAIIMSCDFLLGSHRSSDPAYPDLVTIKQNANRAAALVQQLLAFSCRQTLRPQVVNLSNLVAETNSLLTRLLSENTKLSTAYGADLWPVYIDYSSLQRVIMNLLINAQDALGQAGGVINIEVKNIVAAELTEYNFPELELRDYVLFSIQDSGSGISPEIIEKIFEPFFTTKDVGKGTGLGLAMAYGIVKQSQGVLACHSQVGQGTTFYIFIPPTDLSVIAEASNITTKPEKALSELSGNAKLLIVEDEEAVRKGFVRALKARGYSVQEAESGAQALEIVNETQEDFDLIVCDVLMPEMDGPTLYLHLRQLNPKLKFIFVSGFTKEIFKQKYQELGSDFEFIAKPFSLKDLASKVKESL